MTAASEPPTRALPLAGGKIVDLMWAIAGPAATRMLADFGATVVRVESGGRPELAEDERLHTAAGRRAAASEIDAAIAAWTAARDAHAAEAALQARGVPAAAVETSRDLCADLQLRARGHLASLPHPELGTTCVEGLPVVLSRTPGRVEGDAPTLGRDNLRVGQDVLGYGDDRITALVAAGLLD